MTASKIPNDDDVLEAIKSSVMKAATAAREATATPRRRRDAAKAVAYLRAPLGYEILAQLDDSPDDPSRVIDVETEGLLLKELKEALNHKGIERFVVLTEELGVAVSPPGSDPATWDTFPLLLVDPVDSTDLLLMGFGGAIAVTALWVRPGAALADVVASVVVDLRGAEVFYARRGAGAFVESARPDGTTATERLEPNRSSQWPAILLATFAAKVPRLLRLAAKTNLIQALNNHAARIVAHHGGPLIATRVASGDIDAAIEFSKGFKCIDYGPCFVAQQAGTTVRIIDQPCGPSGLDIATDGQTLKDRLLNTLKRRRKFVVAANDSIANELQKLL